LGEKIRRISNFRIKCRLAKSSAHQLAATVGPQNIEMRIKVKAVIEVVAVFGLTLLLIALVGLSPFGTLERQVSTRFFIEYAVMIAFPLLLLVFTRRNLTSYGLSLRNFSYHLDVMATAFVPMAIASASLAFINYR
jgi:hypothetical protein